MADSEVNIAEKQETRQAPATSIELVRHRGTENLTMRVRGKGGKFKKQPKTMPKSSDVTRLLRNLLISPQAGPDGKMSKGAETRMRRMFDNLFNIATTDPNQPVFDKLGNLVYVTDKDGKQRPLTVMDAKVAMSSVQAFKELMLRAYGMPSKSDDEIEAMKKEAVKVIILQHPELMDKNVVEDKPQPRLEPAFAEVTDIVENK